MTDPAFVSVDWGSSRLRGYAVAADGGILETVESDVGILLAERADLADALTDLLGDWRMQWPEIPILASGMIGSRNGLKEVAYVHTPAGVTEVRAGIDVIDVRGMKVSIVPGLLHRGKDGVDVLRGEETILLGCFGNVGGIETIVLPGTHSKWAQIGDREIIEFCTFATGELFDTMLHSGSLRDLLEAETHHDADAFRDGVHEGLKFRGLLHDYFAVRAEVVTGDASSRGIPSSLSGLLIGYEIAEALLRSLVTPGSSVLIVGDGALVARYLEAMKIAGLAAITLPAVECLMRGWLLLLEDIKRKES